MNTQPEVQTEPIINSIFLFHEGSCEAEILYQDSSTIKIKLMNLGMEGLSMKDRFAKITDRAARHIECTSTILIPRVNKVSLLYRGNVYPAREVMYRDFGIESDPWVKTLVSTEVLNKMLLHDMNAPVPYVEKEAQGLIERIGLFLDGIFIETAIDEEILVALEGKYSNEFEFKAIENK